MPARLRVLDPRATPVRTALDVVASVLLLGGVALALIAAVGQLRLRGLFPRMHAATKPATLGLALVCGAAILRTEAVSDATKLVLVVVLQFLTAPIGAHLIGRAAYHRDPGATAALTVDELEGHPPPGPADGGDGPHPPG